MRPLICVPNRFLKKGTMFSIYITKIIIFSFIILYLSTAYAKTLYVVNQGGAVNIIDLSSERTVKEIPAGRDSINLLLDPSGHYMVVGNGEEEGKIWILDRTTEKIIAKVPVMKGKTAGFPYFVFSKDGARLFAITRYSPELYIIGAGDWRLLKTVPLDLAPEGLDISQDGKFLYIINRKDPNLVIFNIITEKVERTIELGVNPSSIVASPDGKTLYIADKGDSKILILDSSSFKALKKITVGTEPVDMAITKDGRFLYVSCRFSYSLVVIDTLEMRSVANIPVGIFPWGVALNNDGTEAYVANYNENTVSIIDLKKQREVYRLPTGVFPTKVLFVP